MSYTKKDQFQFRGATVEAVPVIADKKFPKEHFPNMFRAPFGSNSSRWYFYPGDTEFYSGITGAISKSPFSDKSFLYRASKELAFQGIDSDVKWGERADYGSCFHLLVALHERKEVVFKFDDLSEKGWLGVVEDFLQDYGYQHLRQNWIDDLKNDFAAYFKWKKDNEVKVIATELMVRHTDWRIATPLDLIVGMKFGGKRILANVNLKTGDKMFGDDYYIQAAMEAYLYNNQMPDDKWKLSGSFLLRPKSRIKCTGDYEMSKNCYNLFPESKFELIGRCVVETESYKATGIIKHFEGDEKSYNAIQYTPYEWLTQFSTNLGDSGAIFPI